MSSQQTPSSSPWPPRRPWHRNKLRNGTFIIPSTGERSRRNFTLRAHPAAHTARQTDGPDDATSDFALFSPSTWPGKADTVKQILLGWVLFLAKWLVSPPGRGVLKCTLAYTLASLWTFWAPLSAILGTPDGKHVVATITVYFHPARSAGSMIEAVLIAIVAVAYAQSVSILSMCTSVLFGGVLGLVALAHTLVLVIFIGGGFGFLGWIKSSMNNPLVNVGSTLASLAIIGVVTKEAAVVTHVFSNQKIFQIFQMLVFAIATTTTVNLLVWRVSAVSLLRISMGKASGCLGDMLAQITISFLDGSPGSLSSEEFIAASSSYSTLHPQLARNLRESKFERYFWGDENLYQLDRAVVKSIETLAQSIGGLRSAATTQFTLLEESHALSPSEPAKPVSDAGWSSTLSRDPSALSTNDKTGVTALSAIEEVSGKSAGQDRSDGNNDSKATRPVQTVQLRNASDIFDFFISLLGPSMKSLAYTLSEVLGEQPFGSSPDFKVTVNDNFRHSLTEALFLFNAARADALEKLYKRLQLRGARSEKLQGDFEEVAAACGHFSFSLQTFGEEMQKYLGILDDLKHEGDHRTRTWRWLQWWRSRSDRSYLTSALPYNVEERESLIKPIKKTAMPNIPEPILKRRDTFNWEATPTANRMVARFSQRLLQLLRKLAKDDVRFGLKVGIGAALWAMFAFIPATRDTYQHWRGEWGLLSFMIVCSMTVGASNTTGWERFIGTLVGAGAAYVNWNVSAGNAAGLILLGWVVAFWSFWMIVARGRAPMGRITLLAYNVSTLYAYSLSQRVDDSADDEGGGHPLIFEIVTHRAIAVTAGILWGLVVCRLIWPISARKKFNQGLSALYLQIGLIWKRGPLAILLRSDCTRSYLKSGEQAALQKYADRLESLRSSATHEFELRGPFPSQQCGRIMGCTKRILDAFYAMSLVTQRKGSLTEGERTLLLYTAHERQVLCDRICHVFQVLASSIMLEYPLTDALPSVSGLRDDLLGKVFRFRKQQQEAGNEQTSQGDGAISAPSIPETVEERDYALLYAYALVTGQVADELRNVAREIEHLYGILDQEAMLL